MQVINSSLVSDFQPQPVISHKISLIQNKNNRPKLAMIWAKESDGVCQRLVARWVTQD